MTTHTSSTLIDSHPPIRSEMEAISEGFAAEMNPLFLDQKETYIKEELDRLTPPISPASFNVSSFETLDERLFDATVSVKIALSQVSMHMDRSWRDTLFHQIDSLHDVDEWEEDDKPIDKRSFASFIRWIILINPQRLPGMGLSYIGNVIAAWTHGSDRLTAEFLPDDRVKWVLSRCIDEETERASGITSVSRLHKCLAPYNPETWFQ